MQPAPEQQGPQPNHGCGPTIKDLAIEIIEHLGLNPSHVRALTIDATSPYITATIYKLDADGSKYLDDTGEPAVTTTQLGPFF